MNNSKLLFSTLLLGSALLFSSCNAQDDEPIYDSNSSTVDTESLHVPHQAALDMVSPIAYSNIIDLHLEPGSNISLIGMDSTPYWNAIEAGAKQAVSEINTLLGLKGKDRVTLTFNAPQNSTLIDEQINILDEELARFPVALGIAMIDSNAFSVQFDQSIDNGIPIIAFDSGSEYDQISTQVGTDNRKASVTLLENTIKMMDNTGELLIVSHDSNATSSALRQEVLKSTLAEQYPDITLVDTLILDSLEERQVTYLYNTQPELWDNIAESTTTIADIPITNELYTQATSIESSVLLEDILTQNPNIKGIICTNGSSSKFVTDAIDNLSMDHDSITICSFDANPDQITLLEDKKLDGLILQNPFGIGYATVISCARAALGETNAATVDTGYNWLTLESIENLRSQNLLYK